MIIVKVISGLASAAIVLALAMPAAADEKKDLRDKALKARAVVEYDSKSKNEKSDDREEVLYVKCQPDHSPAGPSCGKLKNPNRYKNNGFGNGDQDAPGRSEFKNNAENAGGNGA